MIERLAEIIYEHTGNRDAAIREDMMLIADLGLNSFDLVNLACVVEDEFHIEIPDRAIKDFKTVGDVIDFVERYRALDDNTI